MTFWAFFGSHWGFATLYPEIYPIEFSEKKLNIAKSVAVSKKPNLGFQTAGSLSSSKTKRLGSKHFEARKVISEHESIWKTRQIAKLISPLLVSIRYSTKLRFQQSPDALQQD